MQEVVLVSVLFKLLVFVIDIARGCASQLNLPAGVPEHSSCYVHNNVTLFLCRGNLCNQQPINNLCDDSMTNSTDNRNKINKTSNTTRTIQTKSSKIYNRASNVRKTLSTKGTNNSSKIIYASNKQVANKVDQTANKTDRVAGNITLPEKTNTGSINGGQLQPKKEIQLTLQIDLSKSSSSQKTYKGIENVKKLTNNKKLQTNYKKIIEDKNSYKNSNSNINQIYTKSGSNKQLPKDQKMSGQQNVNSRIDGTDMQNTGRELSDFNTPQLVRRNDWQNLQNLQDESHYNMAPFTSEQPTYSEQNYNQMIDYQPVGVDFFLPVLSSSDDSMRTTSGETLNEDVFMPLLNSFYCYWCYVPVYQPTEGESGLVSDNIQSQLAAKEREVITSFSMGGTNVGQDGNNLMGNKYVGKEGFNPQSLTTKADSYIVDKINSIKKQPVRVEKTQQQSNQPVPNGRQNAEKNTISKKQALTLKFGENATMKDSGNQATSARLQVQKNDKRQLEEITNAIGITRKGTLTESSWNTGKSRK